MEVLDRQKKKENPSVGMILCASKDEEVVEYAMNRTMFPMMMLNISFNYRIKLYYRKIIGIN